MLDWSEEHRQMRDAVREFVQREVVPVRDQLEHGDLAPYDVLRRYVRTFGIDDLARERFDREQAGGPPFTSEERFDRAVITLLPMIELCRHCPGLTTAMGVSMNLAGNAIKKGTPEQRQLGAPAAHVRTHWRVGHYRARQRIRRVRRHALDRRARR